jgi:membrane protein YdbS with pleckstrin-like domain
MTQEGRNGKIIKPPIEKIASGREFNPHRRLIFKEWTSFGLFFAFLWTVGSLFWTGLSYAMFVLDDGWPLAVWLEYFWFWWPLGTMVFWAVMLPVYAVVMIGLWMYVRRIRYSLRSEKGDPMPEIFVRKGLLNITEKHVPFRTITNLASRAGPLDRLFGIGNVEIHTAGFSGGTQPGGGSPEEKLEGLLFYEELRDFILQELRRFTGTYVTGTEVVVPTDISRERDTGFVDSEMLVTLRQIRDVLTRLEKKLDKE